MAESSSINLRELATSSEHEVPSKRPLAGQEESQATKAPKPLEASKGKQIMGENIVVPVVRSGQPDTPHKLEGLQVVVIVQADQPNVEDGLPAVQANQQNVQHDQAINRPDLLISQIGRELSISCLLRCSRLDYGSIALVNKGFNSVLRSGLLYKLRRDAGIAEHWVYFSCNLLEWEGFDPVNLRWIHVPKMRATPCFMCADKESLGVGTDLLVLGREIESLSYHRYSILTNTWTTGLKMNEPRCSFACASVGEIGILAGGCDETGKILSSAEIYNSETGSWTTIPGMRTARKMCAGVIMDGKFYVIGGIDSPTNSRILTSAEVYDLETGTWSEIKDMFPERTGYGHAPPLLAVVKNELYGAFYENQEVRRYNKERNAWITLGRLPERTDSTKGWGIAFRGCGDRIVVVGGRLSSGSGGVEIYSWVPSEGPLHWELLASKPIGSFVHNCAIMGC